MTSSDLAAGASSRAQAFLAKISKRHEGVWQQVDGVRQLAHEQNVKWDRRCFIPSQFLLQEFEDPFPCRGRYSRPPKQEQKKRLHDVEIIAGLASWRLTRGIFILDDQDVAEARSYGVPALPDPKVFLSLPQPCVYVPTPGFSWLGDSLSGFFCYLDCLDGELELVLLMDRDEPVFHSLTDVIKIRVEYKIHNHLEPMISREDIIRNWTKGAAFWGLEHWERNLFQATVLGDYWKRPLEPGERHKRPEELTAALRSCLEEDIQPIAGLLYRLCALTAEVPASDRPSLPRPKRTSLGYQMIPAGEVSVWDVDTRIRQFRVRVGDSKSEPGSGTSGHRKRTHARNAHVRRLPSGKRAQIPAAIINPANSQPDERPVVIDVLPPLNRS